MISDVVPPLVDERQLAAVEMRKLLLEQRGNEVRVDVDLCWRVPVIHGQRRAYRWSLSNGGHLPG